MRKLLYILLLWIPFVGIDAKVTKQMADAEYQKGNYQMAISQYEELLKTGVSAEVYYNLGNAYYRSGDITKSVLAYERAKKLAPGDKDVRFNLEFVRSKTTDKIVPENEIFFVTWYHQLANACSSNTWSWVAFVLFITSLVLAGCYLFGTGMTVIKTGFYGAVVCLIISLVMMLFSWQQKSDMDNHDGAVIIQSVVNVKKTPAANSANEMILHEGTKVDIIDRSMKGWLQIHLADGREGWLKPASVEEI